MTRKIRFCDVEDAQREFESLYHDAKRLGRIGTEENDDIAREIQELVKEAKHFTDAKLGGEKPETSRKGDYSTIGVGSLKNDSSGKLKSKILYPFRYIRRLLKSPSNVGEDRRIRLAYMNFNTATTITRVSSMIYHLPSLFRRRPPDDVETSSVI